MCEGVEPDLYSSAAQASLALPHPTSSAEHELTVADSPSHSRYSRDVMIDIEAGRLVANPNDRYVGSWSDLN